MYVKLKDGTVKCVTSEIDVAEIVEEYCGSDLAELIRECGYSKIVEDFEEVDNMLDKLCDKVQDDYDRTLGQIEDIRVFIQNCI